MKNTKLIVALVVLLAAGLGMGCGKGLPTDNWNEELINEGGGTGHTDYTYTYNPNWRIPPRCPAGPSLRSPRDCIPQVPTPTAGGGGPSGP